MSSGERLVSVPEGLDGERLDAAIARMFGVSRTGAAELIGDGKVLIDGKPTIKSDRVTAGAELSVTLPPPPGAVTLTAASEPVPGLAIVYEDNEIIVVDKPRGVAAHPTTGWTGPTVTGGLLGGAMGNLSDRIFRAPGLFRGDVVDWIAVTRYYPIFNLADSAIVCGGILTVILAMRGQHLDGTRGDSATASTSSAPSPSPTDAQVEDSTDAPIDAPIDEER